MSPLLAFVLLVSAGQEQPTRSPDGRTVILPPGAVLGNCLTSDRRPIDLKTVLFGDNRQIDANGRRYRLDRQTLAWERIGDPEGLRHATRIGPLVSRDGNIDIRLQFAFVEGRLSLYWRETYEHHSYRQGVFTIVGDDLVRLCEGEGGFDVSGT
jgi:hypothetical protein